MPRAARKKSESNIYHIMLRGINHQQIFEEDSDFSVFLKYLTECKETTGFDLYAYCLMGNHVHLLLKVNFDNLENIVKIIGSTNIGELKDTGTVFCLFDKKTTKVNVKTENRPLSYFNQQED